MSTPHATPPIPVRVALTHASELVVHGLRSMLEPFRSTIEVIGTMPDADRPDVILVDSFGIDDGGLADVTALRAARPDVDVVLYTEADDERLLLRALRAGVRGYVLKSRTAADLVDDVVRVASGQVVVDPDLAVRSASLAARLIDLDRTPAALLGLTAREVDVLEQLESGATAREIGVQLYVSHETVRSHLKRIYRKLGVHDRPSAVLRARQEGILRDDGSALASVGANTPPPPRHDISAPAHGE